MNKKSLTLNGMTSLVVLHAIISLLVVIASFLSLRHFFQANFPSSLFDGSFCDISGFFNCDNSAYSFIAVIFGVPLGYFGMAVGMSSFMGIIFPSPAFERTNKFINFLNVIGILGLIFISVFILRSVCLYCLAFYIVSFANFILYYKKGIDAEKGFFRQHLRPSFKYLFGIGLLTLIGAVNIYFYHQAKIEAQGGGTANKIVQQFFNLPKVKAPSIISPYYVSQAAEKFEEAPIRIIEYSDFQCPDCLKLYQDFKDLKKEFGDKMNIVYQFFPLDAKCNDVVSKDLHPQACTLSYIAAYDPDKFINIHDEIFENFYKARSEEWIMDLAKKYGVENALTDENTKKIVIDIINTGKEYEPTSEKYKYGIRSTPTMIINERMVIGTLPRVQLRAILKAILVKAEEDEKKASQFIESWK